MLKTTGVIEESLKDYSNPKCRIGWMVKDGKYHPVIRGLYEEDGTVPGHLLAHDICSPSYISFEWALAYYGMIPESVVAVTCASCGKHKDKVFESEFGRFMYSDIPARVFHLGVETIWEKGRPFWIASREKAVCDKLYKLPPVGNMSELEELLYDDMRFYEEDIMGLDANDICILADRYHCRNVDHLRKYLVKS